MKITIRLKITIYDFQTMFLETDDESKAGELKKNKAE